MFTKTICTPGTPIIVVPEGLLVVLKYNMYGQLENIQLGYDPLNYNNAPIEVLDSVKNNKLVPLTINVTGGTTYIYGLFYCSEDVIVSGIIPTCLREELMKMLVSSPEKFQFLSANVTSEAANFKSALGTRNWLDMNGFKKCPMIISPNIVNDDNVFELLKKRYSQYRWPIMSGYYIEKSSQLKFISTSLVQNKIKNVTQVLSSEGVVSAIILFENDDKLTCSWATVLDFDLDKDTAVLLQDEKVYHSRRYKDTKRLPKDRNYTCPVCGKQHIIEYGQSIVECEDNNCATHFYNKIVQFVTTLGLPEMSYDEYEKLRDAEDNREIVNFLPDLLLIDKYKNEIVNCTMAQLLQAIVSPECVRNKNLFQQFVDACSNTYKTISYYLNNPEHIKWDLKIENKFLNNFIDWLNVDFNRLVLNTMMQTPNINIIYSGKRYEGAPIFRGRTICITGDFMHGNLQDIISILKCYDANVSSVFVENAVYLVIGGLHSNIDGGLVAAAKQVGIPVVEELDFFKAHEIDADLNANLE